MKDNLKAPISKALYMVERVQVSKGITGLLVIMCLLLLQQSFAQGFLRADGKKIVNDKGPVLLRGMGLGGWMLQEPYMLRFNGIAQNQHEIRAKIEGLVGKEKTAAFYKTWLANHCRKADIDSMAAWGFNSVRLPMHYNLFTLPIEQEAVPGNDTWLPQGFTMVDSLLAWCKANRVYLILDLHAAPGGQGRDIAISDGDTTKPFLWESEANRQKTIALWQQLAKRYANEQWIGGYDLINETNWGFKDRSDKNGCAEEGNEPLKKLSIDITNAIRAVDKNHLIVVEGNCWGNNYKNIFPLWDKNMVVSFHKYWNYNNPASIQNFIKIRDEQNVPIWCGETGENSNVWFKDAIELFETNDIGWACWPLKKLGFNNPMEVKVDPGYQALLGYMRGQGQKPSQDEAYGTLMRLAENVRAENTIVHKDVLDAMFRQVQSNATLPFKNHVAGGSAILFATDYDLGRNGEAYYDKDTADYHVSTGKNTPGNKGRTYRNDGVDIVRCSDTTTNGYQVSSFEAGEWMQYTVLAPATARYKLNIRVQSSVKGSGLSLVVNSKAVGNGAVVVDATDSAWKTIQIDNVSLSKGVNKLRVVATAGELKLNYLQLQDSRMALRARHQ